MSHLPSEPSPVLLFDSINSYQRSAAIKAAVELELFSAVSEGKQTVRALAERCQASERGIRILADYLTILWFLTKENSRYSLSPDSAVFLDQGSPAYMGGIVAFMLDPTLMAAFADLTTTVRTGRTILPGQGSVEPDNPLWVKFAKAMAPMAKMTAQQAPQVVACPTDRQIKILDIAAGHGLYGASFAQRYPNAQIVALDWPNVLEVARKNAQAMGVGDRFTALPGDAFSVDFGEGYDLILVTNFLHHFDVPTCETFLKKVHTALAEGGRALILEFVPNPDRVSPPVAAAFSLMMLGSTPSGDAYTFAEIESMCANAGFTRSELHPLPPQSLIVSQK